MNTIAVDCGASFIKGALLSEGQICRKIKRQAPGIPKNRDLFSACWINSLLDLVRNMILELGGSEREAVLCISNEMHGFLLAYADGTPLTDYISWQEELGAVEVDGQSSLSILGSRELNREICRTGMNLRNGLPSCNLLYLHRTGALKKCTKQIYFYTLGDFILRSLSGKNPVCHPTNAAASGLYDIVSGTWNRKLMQAACADHISFISVGRGCERLSFQLENMTLCAFPAVGDQQAALLGSGLSDEKTLSFNLGTGAQVSMLAGDLVFSKEYQIRPYFGGRSIKTVPHIPSGRALNVYFRFVKDLLDRIGADVADDDIWKVFMQQEPQRAAAAPEIKCDLSFFDNAVTDNRTGSIYNIGEYDFTIGNLMSAAVKQMAENAVLCAQRMGVRQENIARIIFSGGIARRFEAVRNQIVGNYPNVQQCEVAEDETLMGLYRYSEMLFGERGKKNEFE